MIKKFRTLEEAERDLWVMEPDEAYYRKVLAMLESFAPKPHPHGVFKYLSLDEAQRDRERWSGD